MSAFTDDDLKLLKDDMADQRYVDGSYMPNAGILKALIERMEAAEAVFGDELVECECTFCARRQKQLEAWRKSKGDA